MRSINVPARGRHHGAPITHVAFSPHAPELASCSYDGNVIIWRIRPDGGLEPRLKLQHRRLVNASAWAMHQTGLLATAAADKTIGIWRVGGDEPQLLSVLARHTDDVNAVAWLPDGERLISVSEDSTASLWEPMTGRFLGRFAAHAGHCMDVSVSVGGRILTVGEDGAVFVGTLDRPDARVSRVFSCSVEGCSWSPDGTRAALACDDGLVRLVSPELDVLDEIPCAETAARGVVWATDGSNRLVVGSYDARVRVLEGDRVVSVAAGGMQWPRSVDTRGNLVAVGSFGGSPVLYELNGLRPLHDGGPATHGPNALAVSGDEALIGLDSGGVLALPVASIAAGEGRGARLYPLGASPILSLAPATGGFLAGTYGGEVIRVSATNGQVIARADLNAPVPSLATRGLMDLAAAGTYNGELITLDVSGQQLEIQARRGLHHGSIKSVAWMGNDSTITAATDAAIRWTPLDGPGHELWWHGNLINAVALDTRGVVASASRDRRVQVGRVGESGNLLWRRELFGSDESVKAVAVLGQDRSAVVLAGSYDFGLYAWTVSLNASPPPDLRAGELVHAFTQGVSTMLAVNPRQVLVASWDGTVALFELDDQGRPVCRGGVSMIELADGVRRIGIDASSVSERVAQRV